MPDTPHFFVGFVEDAVKELVLEVAANPLSHFSEKTLQLRLSSRLLKIPDLSTPLPTGIAERYRRELELICGEEHLRGRDIAGCVGRVYSVPPLQMEYGNNLSGSYRIDIAILDPNDIGGIIYPLSLQNARKKYLVPVVGVEFGTEKSLWTNMQTHLSNDAMKVTECRHGYAVNVMRNPNFTRRSKPRAKDKDAQMDRFRQQMTQHAAKFPSITWIGLILNLAFVDVELFLSENAWETFDVSNGVRILEERLDKWRMRPRTLTCT